MKTRSPPPPRPSTAGSKSPEIGHEEVGQEEVGQVGQAAAAKTRAHPRPSVRELLQRLAPYPSED